MKKSKITALVMATLMFIGIVPAHTPSFAADPEANNPAYAYFMNTAEGSAHVWLGSEIEEKGIKFYDGQAMGITDSKDPLYNENSTVPTVRTSNLTRVFMSRPIPSF